MDHPEDQPIDPTYKGNPAYKGDPVQKGQKLYEGKAKAIFATDTPNQLIQYFKDDATAYNAQKHEVISGKGKLNNAISYHIMTALGSAGIRHHLIKKINEREQLIRKCTIIPVEVVVRNIAAGSMVGRLAGMHIPISLGTCLKSPIVEYYLKEDALNDPIITAEHITEFGLASEDELNYIRSTALAINRLLTNIFADIGIVLVDFKLEFGRPASSIAGEPAIILADEISPDNCRLWDRDTGDIKDKDRFRKDLGGLVDAYQDIASRFGLTISLP